MLGESLKHSGFVAIVGPPNAGKSTFMNFVLGKKISIVTPRAQTTRNKINGILTTADSQVIFTDTPGITKSDFGKLLNNWMNKYSFSASNDADLTLFFVDTSQQHPEIGLGEEEQHILDNLSTSTSVFLIANKSDVVKPMRSEDTIRLYSRHFSFKQSFIISAETGEGVPQLLEAVTTHLPSGPKMFPDGMDSDAPDDFMITEIIREKIFTYLSKELPYHTTVTIDLIKNHDTKDILLINATIHVARKSQKGIVIGKGGSMLR
ncbi:GTPase Era, partial [bacterium]|nr:GTPase Era [bacterium]